MRKINITAMKIFFFLIIALILNACSSSNVPVIDPTNYASLSGAMFQPKRYPSGPEGLSAIRVKALEDIGMTIAAQGALIRESDDIDARLTRDKWYLDSLYNFNGMMLSHGVLPPVLEEGDNSININDPNTIRVADKTYKIVAQARFASTPPNWRDYLWMSFPKPDIPTGFLLPRTKAEQVVWVRVINLGWAKGIEQAHSIFRQNVARLNRDFKGMTLYRSLLAKNMISAPYVSRTELGVTGDGTDMRINDQVLRITELPRLQTDSRGWQAIVVPNGE